MGYFVLDSRFGLCLDEHMEWLTVIAIVSGPLIALRLQTLLSRRREARDRRLGIFRTLMVTRGSVLSPHHVEALNSIDLEFNAENAKDKSVREGWKAYLDHLGQKLEDNASENDQKRWNEKTQELLVELLHAMSQAVGHDFDKTYIKRTAYIPIRYGNVELEQDFIRRSMVELFLGTKSVPIEIRPAVRREGGESSEEHLRRLLIDHYEGGKPIKVILVGRGPHEQLEASHLDPEG